MKKILENLAKYNRIIMKNKESNLLLKGIMDIFKLTKNKEEEEVKTKSKIEWGYPDIDHNVIYLTNIYQPTHIKRHPYHIVKASIAPIMTSIPLAYFVLSLFNVIDNNLGLWIAISIFVSGLMIWIFSIVFDSIYEQQHTYEVKRGLIMGMLLFILSEVMFFFSFFWSYFYISLAPTVAIGCVWPPYGLTVYSYMGLPLLNTIVLLLSGALLTDAYGILTEQKSVHEIEKRYVKMLNYFEVIKAIFNKKQTINDFTFIDIKRNAYKNVSQDVISNKKLLITEGILEKNRLDLIANYLRLGQLDKKVENLDILEYQYVNAFIYERNALILKRLFLTLLCAALFLFCQSVEYKNAPFGMNDGIYGSLFYLLTGFHGFHVLVGSILILIVTFRFLGGNFNVLNIGTKFQIFKNRSTGFACTLFYWHFVDIVWIFLYIVIYWWSSN